MTRLNPSRGRCFVYVAPCAWEDLVKVGHSRDPLGRLEAFHRRWYEVFDPDLAWLVELDRVREATALELALRHGLVEHNLSLIHISSPRDPKTSRMPSSA